MPKRKPLSIQSQYKLKHELDHALGMLRVSPLPPARNTPAYELRKVEYIMADKQGKMAKSVEEICELPVIKDVLAKMLRDEDPKVIAKALKLLPSLIAALVRAGASPRSKDEDMPKLDEEEI